MYVYVWLPTLFIIRVQERLRFGNLVGQGYVCICSFLLCKCNIVIYRYFLVLILKCTASAYDSKVNGVRLEGKL